MTHLMSNYGRFPVAFVQGAGTRLYDEAGREYLDFTSGIAVTNLGHCHPNVTQAIQQQAETLVHTSNLFQIPGQEAVAQKLCQLSGLDRAFFCNSGAEANEAAIKLARKHSKEVYGEHKFEILTLEDAFHGRTLATVSATPRPKFHEGFAPLMPGFQHVAKNLAALEAAISPQTCAILLEPVQGEGGVLPLTPEFLQGVRNLCDQHGLLLILDEVQTGIGRTGTMFAFQQAGIQPDILTLAKALGNGIPVGATLATEQVASAFTPGTHGSTFGGTPLVMAAVLATLQTIEEEGLLQQAVEMGEQLALRLQDLLEHYDCLSEVRGLGLLRGVVLDRPVAPLVAKCLDLGLLVLSAGEKTLRLLPPLTVSSQDIHLGIKLLEQALQEVITPVAQP
ncbi:aspartate aminotransferase family protein [Tumebacillus permanentifrigoris]|uniref:Acetylornithine aminotransferase n=1 Tax=Tumebacillus permanentifrigoris TaxID=378543 RepID=A0A316D5Q6_9BACL|nr:aspartate aminotransferase family protein [Tumebacillus permanentifrigoris]PWK09576.1 acetylornithine aminotransferase [Tumebacillus permanentifrigoris]